MTGLYKKATLFFSFLALCLFSNVFAQGYEIEMKYADSNTPSMKANLVWNINPTNCKLQMNNQMEGRNVASVFHTDLTSNTLKMYEVNPENGKKIYYTVNVSSLKPDARFDYKRGKANITADTKTIAGINCKKIIFSTDKFVSEFWLAESLPDVKPWANFFQSYPELNAIAEAGLSGFPLSAIVKDLSGKVLVSFDAIRVNEKKFSATDFLVPAEYIDAASLQRK